VAQLLTWLAALDATALTPIDAALYLRDVVVASMPGGWTWELASYRPAALAVRDRSGDIRLVARAHPGGGVEIALPAMGAGATADTLVAASPARLIELAAAIADATQRAITARDAFAARPFGIRRIAAEIAAAARLGEPQTTERYPAWPSAMLFDAAGRFVVAQVVESADGFAIAIGRAQFFVRSADELAELLPAIASAVATDLQRLRVERIQPRDRFRVRAAFGCFSPGSEIEFDDVSVISREGDRVYRFASLRGSARFAFAELDEDHAAVLAELDRYLERL
jgi:hypothetical protein